MHLQEPLGPERTPALKFLMMALQHHLGRYRDELLRLRAEAGVVQHQTSDPFCGDDHPLCATWAARVRELRLHVPGCKSALLQCRPLMAPACCLCGPAMGASAPAAPARCAGP